MQPEQKKTFFSPVDRLNLVSVAMLHINPKIDLHFLLRFVCCAVVDSELSQTRYAGLRSHAEAELLFDSRVNSFGESSL